MAKTIALDPVVSRTGTTKVAAPPAARTATIALDPVIRTFTTTQTATPPPAQ